MPDAEMPGEGLFETPDVLVASLAPAVRGGVGGVSDLSLRDRRLGVVYAGFHSMFRFGIAVTNLAPHSRA